MALGGPQVKNPRLLKTRLGADLYELTEGQLKAGENRIISGSVLWAWPVMMLITIWAVLPIRSLFWKKAGERAVRLDYAGTDKYTVTRTTLGHFFKKNCSHSPHQ